MFPCDAVCSTSILRHGTLTSCHRSSVVSVHIRGACFLKQKLQYRMLQVLGMTSQKHDIGDVDDVIDGRADDDVVETL